MIFNESQAFRDLARPQCIILDMRTFPRWVAVSTTLGLLAVAGCSSTSNNVVAGADWVIPPNPENSAHGYSLEPDRIPSFGSCSEWSDFWEFGGPAVSFEVATNNPQVPNLAVSTEIFVATRHLDTDNNGIICDEEVEAETIDADASAVEETAQVKKPSIIETVVQDVRSFRDNSIDSDLNLDTFSGPNVTKDIFDHYVGSVEKAGKFWAQFNKDQSLVRSVTVVAHEEETVLRQRVSELGLPQSAASWWPRAENSGGGTVIQADDGYSHVFFRLTAGEADKPHDDYAFHEITHSYQDGLGAISASKDFPCWFGEGYAMVVGLSNASDTEMRTYEIYKDWRNSAIASLKQYMWDQDESISSQLTEKLLLQHSNNQCNTDEPLFGYRLGALASEVWIEEFGFERTVDFMKNIEDYEFEEQFKQEFGIRMDDWLITKALPPIYEILRKR
jgi:hypothetical protein